MKAIVVEDSRLARQGLVKMLAEFPQVTVIGDADHPATALTLIQQTRPDVIFLDIHMPGASGFDLLDQLNYAPRIIFTTAYSEYAIRSFDYNTIDYLLKPISQERLAAALHKLTGHEPAPVVETKTPLELSSRMLLQDNDQCHLVSLDAISCFESCKNHVMVFFNGRRVFVKKSLNTIEERLPKSVFFRANRQHIINLQAVRHIEAGIHEGFEVTLNDGKSIAISRRNAAALKTLLSF